MSISPTNRIRTKYVAFGVIGLMLAYVLLHNERFIVDPDDPIWEHYQTFKWWLLPHGLLGACALLLAPMQFSDRLRARFLERSDACSKGQVYDSR